MQSFNINAVRPKYSVLVMHNDAMYVRLGNRKIAYDACYQTYHNACCQRKLKEKLCSVLCDKILIYRLLKKNVLLKVSILVYHGRLFRTKI